MIKEALKKILRGEVLSSNEVKKIFASFLENNFSPSLAASFLTALAVRGERAEEIKVARDVLLAKAIKLNLSKKVRQNLIDVCGTGGKAFSTFNVSTLVSFVLAAGGVYVAKHGNRSFSSLCGSADIMEAWGINIEASPLAVGASIERVGIGFIYAPLYHPAMRHIAGLRKEIGIRTIFNLVGPLANPALPSFQMVGVYRKDFTENIAKVLQKNGLKRYYVVWGEGIGDEVSIFGKTKVTTSAKGGIKTFYLYPSDFGLKKSGLKNIKTKDIKDSLKLAEKVLSARASTALDVVLANAALAFVLLKRTSSLKEGVRKSYALIKSGKVKEKMEELKTFLQSYA